jgi:hypothetical protein
MNLYAMIPHWAPGDGIQLVMAESDEDGLEWAAHVLIGMGLPAGQVFRVATDLEYVGDIEDDRSEFMKKQTARRMAEIERSLLVDCPHHRS